MRFLPKANPLYENIDAGRTVIPDVLEKLGSGGFTGYIQFETDGFEFYGIFAKGKLLCALSSENGREKTGFEAIAMLFDKVLSCGGHINVYRMTADLVVCAHAMVAGTRLLNGEEVRQVDIKGMLSRLKVQSVNGAVRFFTTMSSAMMFYKDGQPIGFYHKGAAAIESSPDESRRIAALPGARVEISSTKPLDELMQYDLLQMVNLQKLWETAKARSTVVRIKEQSVAEELPSALGEQQLAVLVEDLCEIAAAYLSRAGKTAVESCLKSVGGAAQLQNQAKRSAFLTKMEADGRTLDADARIDEMIDLMKSEIAGRCAV